MEILTLQSDEISVSVGDLNNIAGMAWMATQFDAINLSFRKINNWFYAEATCNKSKILINVSGNFENRSEVNFKFNVETFRNFVKKLTKNYNNSDGKVIIKLYKSKIEVTMPSMLGAFIYETVDYSSDFSCGE